jgi:hypothetical protein
MGGILMKYLYINLTEDRVVTISTKPEQSLRNVSKLTEYIVPKDFDLGKDMPDENGGIIRLDGFLTATEFLERFNSNHVAQRVGEYPPIEDYLDGVVKGDQEQIQAYIDACLAVKAKYPKPD